MFTKGYHSRAVLWAIMLVGCLGVILFIRVYAAPELQDQPTPTPSAPLEIPESEITPSNELQQNLSLADEYCLSCHGIPGDTYTLPNGDVLDLFVSAEMHESSVHGELGYACVQCHTDVGEYPHPPIDSVNQRQLTLKLNESCDRCHTLQAELEKDSVHALARSAGYLQAAACVDCHTSHEVQRLTDPETSELLPETRQWIPQRCGLCHNEIYKKYLDSVHGSSLSEGNTDVPTCIDCHGVHNIENPQTAYFRLHSPQICAECHSDTDVMNKYGLPTNVLDTYVSDFHGTTVAIFEKTAPDARVNSPVCYDCHGVHDISRVDNPSTGLQMKQNLLVRCQVCHPDADLNFPPAWMSHYSPSPDTYPLVYYVDLFYKYFIPLTLGGMAILVVMDAGRLLLNRARSRRSKHAPPISDENSSEMLKPELQLELDMDGSLSEKADLSQNETKDNDE